MCRRFRSRDRHGRPWDPPGAHVAQPACCAAIPTPAAAGTFGVEAGLFGWRAAAPQTCGFTLAPEHPPMLTRRATLAGLAGLGLPVAARAQGGPSITIVVPYPPGGPVDLVARMIAQETGGELGQSMVVENRPG